tara:strand:+ start:3933 stop:4694 length:762 start_codon:yes stop_codon:yes gene_type:complete
MITLTSWDGTGTPPDGDVLVDDVFCPNRGLSSSDIVFTFAAIADRAGQTFWLATENTGWAGSWFRWGGGIEVCGNGHPSDRSGFRTDGNGVPVCHRCGHKGAWRMLTEAGRLPNLTLLTPPSQLDALLRLPAARYGVVAGESLESDCYNCGGVGDTGIGPCDTCVEGGTLRDVLDVAIRTERVSAVLLRGEWARCGECHGLGEHHWKPTYANPDNRFDKEPVECLSCNGTGLSPEARTLAVPCRDAGVEVGRV